MITVVYYTSNKEDEAFELKIRSKLLKVIGNLPLISVSQKPIDFGCNICIGDIGASDVNVLYQLLRGCEEADTPFIATAEADCLYPPTGYFDFKPPDVNMAYRYTNLWMLWRGGKVYRKKEYSLCAQIVGKECLIEAIHIRLRKSKTRGDIFKRGVNWEPFESSIPCVNIKTGNGMRNFTGVVRGVEPEGLLPHWGTAIELNKELWD
jgi:hypothetical protein